jgi:hypothetical protein
MDIKDILSISGKPGLFKVISHTKNGVIVESLIDKKRIPAYSSDKIGNLEEISIYTTDKEKPLKDVFKTVFEKENGGRTIDPKSDDKKLRAYFEEIVPDYDKERVYCSDMKKLFSWYNILFDSGLLKFDEEKPEENTETVKEIVPETENKKPAKEKAEKKETKPKKTKKTQ